MEVTHINESSPAIPNPPGTRYDLRHYQRAGIRYILEQECKRYDLQKREIVITDTASKRADCVVVNANVRLISSIGSGKTFMMGGLIAASPCPAVPDKVEVPISDTMILRVPVALPSKESLLPGGGKHLVLPFTLVVCTPQMICSWVNNLKNNLSSMDQVGILSCTHELKSIIDRYRAWINAAKQACTLGQTIPQFPWDVIITKPAACSIANLPHPYIPKTFDKFDIMSRLMCEFDNAFVGRVVFDDLDMLTGGKFIPNSVFRVLISSTTDLPKMSSDSTSIYSPTIFTFTLPDAKRMSSNSRALTFEANVVSSTTSVLPKMEVFEATLIDGWDALKKAVAALNTAFTAKKDDEQLAKLTEVANRKAKVEKKGITREELAGIREALGDDADALAQVMRTVTLADDSDDDQTVGSVGDRASVNDLASVGDDENQAGEDHEMSIVDVFHNAGIVADDLSEYKIFMFSQVSSDIMADVMQAQRVLNLPNEIVGTPNPKFNPNFINAFCARHSSMFSSEYAEEWKMLIAKMSRLNKKLDISKLWEHLSSNKKFETCSGAQCDLSELAVGAHQLIFPCCQVFVCPDCAPRLRPGVCPLCNKSVTSFVIPYGNCSQNRYSIFIINEVQDITTTTARITSGADEFSGEQVAQSRFIAKIVGNVLSTVTGVKLGLTPSTFPFRELGEQGTTFIQPTRPPKVLVACTNIPSKFVVSCMKELGIEARALGSTVAKVDETIRWLETVGQVMVVGSKSKLAGMNLPFLTHIIMSTPNNFSDIVQAVGRGQRFGRIDSLTVIYAFRSNGVERYKKIVEVYNSLAKYQDLFSAAVSSNDVESLHRIFRRGVASITVNRLRKVLTSLRPKFDWHNIAAFVYFDKHERNPAMPPYSPEILEGLKAAGDVIPRPRLADAYYVNY